jgi:IMP dehydrogenase
MVNINKESKLNYDDVLIVPQYSEIESRSKVDISSNLTPSIKLNIPIVIANMESVVNQSVIYAASQMGAAAIMHRYDKPNWIQREINELDHNRTYPIIPSIGVGNDQVKIALDYMCHNFNTKKTHAICIDIAHGDSKQMYDTIKAIREEDKYFPIIAGNIVTRDAAKRMLDAGANAIKVGIGPGLVCTTRANTGAGYPQLSAIMEIAPVLHGYNATLIADGGIRTAGDCVKAFVAGADTVMIGSLFAGSKEIGKSYYRGMASADAQREFKGYAKNIEGKSMNVEPSYKSVKDILQELKESIQSGFSYVGARNINELRERAEFVLIRK